MNIKMATNSQLSTIESKKQTSNKQNRNRIIDMEIIWRVISWEAKGEEWGERHRIKKCNW